MPSLILHTIAWLALSVTLVLAIIVMFASADMADYKQNVGVFYTWSFVCTIIYFAASYWALKRTKKLNQAHTHEFVPPTESTEPVAASRGDHSPGV
ncbi:hypothetical protein [Rubinisphaera margarita]|uniref:hypothetical protein n=1 Tax=Rubinisphaera margarita TaxID=2909586 RepID=UPI001EE78ECD|nr:hypothetical protein [Rubinisphaera margarita]MCG6156590.1 hypothetical protein [Rubinisphaera margarita]